MADGYENFYIGSYTPMEPEFGEYFTGARIAHGRLGAPTSPMTADQIRQASKLLNTGMKTVEVGAIQQDVFEAIPKQHFKEMRRLAELTGTEMSVHGPITDLAGFSQQGWHENQRRQAEAQMVDVLEKARQLDAKGNVPVTFHAQPPFPTQRWVHVPQVEADKMIDNIQNRAVERGGYSRGEDEIIKDLRRGRRMDSVIAVDQETGQIQEVKYQQQYWPEGPIEFDPKSRIDMMNYSQWESEKFGVTRLEEEKMRLAKLMNVEEYGAMRENLKGVSREKIDELYERERESQRLDNKEQQILNADRRLKQIEYPIQETNFHQYTALRNMFNDFMKFGKEEYKDDKGNVALRRKDVENNVKKIWEAYGKTGNVYSDELIEGLRNEISRLPHPQKWRAADEFAREKVAETTAGAAFTAWKKFGDKAPTIALENYPDTVMSTGEDSARVIEASRKAFVDRALAQGIPADRAKAAAERLIGVTWDYGHVNMLRKYGFPEKFIVEETAKVAEYVKKAHLTDNFGFADSHLPPGMGNIPFKAALAELEKKGIDVPQIVEASGLVQHFKVNPHPYVLEALGSPLYTYMAGPYWNQMRASYGAYFSGYGEFLPDFHFKTYGSPSFSALPTELGGEMPGERRQSFTGQGME
ncbi:MAG TPA: sugar phosphate isomerase/epimerase [Nanoarchaeota archaeon]|nr:sugar phosphate isomerase/epimerase [Nanoarchaeota archaeon]